MCDWTSEWISEVNTSSAGNVMSVRTFLGTRTQTHMWTHTQAQTHTQRHTDTYTCRWTHTREHTVTHAHTCRHTHVHNSYLTRPFFWLNQCKKHQSVLETHTVSSGRWPQTHHERLCFLRYFPFEKWEKGVLWRPKRRWDKGTWGPTAFLPCSPQFSPACPWCNWSPIKQRPRPSFHWAMLPCFYRDLDVPPGLSTRRGLPTRWVSECVCESHSVKSNCIVHGILQARIPEWVAFPFSRGSSQPRDRTQVSHIAGGFFASWAVREASHKVVVSNSIPPRPLQGFHWRRPWGNWERERDGGTDWGREGTCL